MDLVQGRDAKKREPVFCKVTRPINKLAKNANSGFLLIALRSVRAGALIATVAIGFYAAATIICPRPANAGEKAALAPAADCVFLVF